MDNPAALLRSNLEVVAYTCPRCNVPAGGYRVNGVNITAGTLLAAKLTTGLEPVTLLPCGHTFLFPQAGQVASGVDAATQAEWTATAQAQLLEHAALLERAQRTGYAVQVGRYRQALMSRTGEAPQILAALQTLLNMH